MKIVSAAEMREIDRATSGRFGVPSLTLMENAGSAVARFILSDYPLAQRVSVICGKGNNGGDGFVVARQLAEAGRVVRVLLLGVPEDLRGDAAAMFQKLSILPLVVRDASGLESVDAAPIFNADLIVDAVLGTGFRPPVSALYAAVISRINESQSPVIAVDIPSGADADAMHAQSGTVARADAVVTFTAPRPAHVFAELTNGPTVIAPIGSPSEAIMSKLGLHLSTAADFADLLAPRQRDANKGSYGHVLVVGGSLGKAGAAAMAGFAALRAGAGLATVATARSALPTVAGFYPELMTEPLEETNACTISRQALESVAALVGRKSVLAIGPGISRHTETVEFVRGIEQKHDTPMVLDADALNAFEGSAGELMGRGRSIVITPHPGEMSRLTGMTIADVQGNRVEVARKFAREHGLIVVLKGHRTLIASPEGEVWANPTGNPGMATGGTGDVLTGMVAGLIAQHPERVLEATVLAVYLHGLAGDLGANELGENSLIATDLLRYLPEAYFWIRERAGVEIRIHS
jgi:ADP-dependent NAD(P)H-hydrate dehydratase / NAD(P)H-hydrate epimerase